MGALGDAAYHAVQAEALDLAASDTACDARPAYVENVIHLANVSGPFLYAVAVTDLLSVVCRTWPDASTAIADSLTRVIGNQAAEAATTN